MKIGFKNALQDLKKGNLIIIYDDIEDKMGALVGIADYVNAKKVNYMIKTGKGLVSVCIDAKKLNQLGLPMMVREGKSHNMSSAISIDYKTSSTGISAFERAETIKAITKKSARFEDFKAPGHVFPVLSREKGLFERLNLVEASIDLARMVSDKNETYLCEILNSHGEIASESQIRKFAESNDVKVVTISEILYEKRGQIMCGFQAKVVKGRGRGNSLGFPTANLDVKENPSLSDGVYGVTITHNGSTYFGVMNKGRRPTIDHSLNLKTYHEIHIMNFNKVIYNEALEVNVCFYIRDEYKFSHIDQLIFQIIKDISYAEKRFNLLKNAI